MSLSDLFKEKPPAVTSSSNLPWPSAERTVRLSTSSERQPFLKTSPLWNVKRSPSLREFLNPNYMYKSKLLKKQNIDILEEPIDFLANLKNSGLSKAELLESTKRTIKTPKQSSNISRSQSHSSKSEKKSAGSHVLNKTDTGVCKSEIDLQSSNDKTSIQTTESTSEIDLPLIFGKSDRSNLDQHNSGDKIPIQSTRILRSHSKTNKKDDPKVPSKSTSTAFVSKANEDIEVKTVQSFPLKGSLPLRSKARQSITTTKPEMGNVTSTMITDIISSVVKGSKHKVENLEIKNSNSVVIGEQNTLHENPKNKTLNVPDNGVEKIASELVNSAAISHDKKAEIASSKCISTNKGGGKNGDPVINHIEGSCSLAADEENCSLVSIEDDTLNVAQIALKTDSITSKKAEKIWEAKQKFEGKEKVEENSTCSSCNELSPKEKVLTSMHSPFSSEPLSNINSDCNDSSSSTKNKKLIENPEEIVGNLSNAQVSQKAIREACQDGSKKMKANYFVEDNERKSGINNGIDAKDVAVIDDCDVKVKEVEDNTDAGNSCDGDCNVHKIVDGTIISGGDNNGDDGSNINDNINATVSSTNKKDSWEGSNNGEVVIYDSSDDDDSSEDNDDDRSDENYDDMADNNNVNDDIRKISVCGSECIRNEDDNESSTTDTSIEDYSETQLSNSGDINKEKIDDSIEVLVFRDDSDDNDGLEEGEIHWDDCDSDELNEENEKCGNGDQLKTKTKRKRKRKRKRKEKGRKIQKTSHAKLKKEKPCQISPLHASTVSPAAEPTRSKSNETTQFEKQLAEEEQGYSLLSSLSTSTVDITVAASEKELIKKKTRGGKAGAKIRKKLQRRMNDYLARKRREMSQARQREPAPRPVCHYYLRGSCNKGAECPFRHEGTPTKPQEVCKFYLVDACNKGDSCPYLHGSFPCKYFHSQSGFCRSGGHCRFSHDPLTSETQAILDKFLVDQKARDEAQKQEKQEVEPDVDTNDLILLESSPLENTEGKSLQNTCSPVAAPFYAVRYGSLADEDNRPFCDVKTDLESPSKQDGQKELPQAVYLVPGMY